MRTRPQASGHLNGILEFAQAQRKGPMKIRAVQGHHGYDLQQVIHRGRRRATVARPFHEVLAVVRVWPATKPTMSPRAEASRSAAASSLHGSRANTTSRMTFVSNRRSVRSSSPSPSATRARRRRSATTACRTCERDAIDTCARRHPCPRQRRAACAPPATVPPVRARAEASGGSRRPDVRCWCRASGYSAHRAPWLRRPRSGYAVS